ncbi:MAG: orotate phosphoribosyltransferase [Candidatus Desulfofervidus auxilii]|nr:orotate phosphoribosyltransferase [Candidatus Desulfofervidus auxilii]
MSSKDKLFQLLYKNSFLYDPNKRFKLSSGKYSDFYIDGKKTTLTGEGMALVGEVIWKEIKNLNIDAVGGLTLGADPIVCAVVMQAFKDGKKIDGFIVRKEPKGHGTKSWIEGNIKKGMKVVIVEDVVTTGASALKAIERAEEAGLKVIKVIILVDREEGGKQAIEEKGYDCLAIFSRSDFMKLHKKDA